MCEHPDDGETVRGTKIERQREEKTRRGEGGEGGEGGREGGRGAVGGVGVEAITSPLQWLTLTPPPVTAINQQMVTTSNPFIFFISALKRSAKEKLKYEDTIKVFTSPLITWNMVYAQPAGSLSTNFPPLCCFGRPLRLFGRH